MFDTMRGTLVPARKWFLALVVALIAATPIAGRADDGMVDVRTLPRLADAVEETARTEPYSLRYGVPTVVAITAAATRKLLAAHGWVPYVQPLEESSSSLLFKKGIQGLGVSFTQGLGRPDQSVVYYTANRINANVPFPVDATDIVFDGNRPFLGCTTAATIDATLAFFQKEMAAAGWSPLSAADTGSRWPNANLNEAIENDVRAYFRRDGDNRQPPVMLSLRRRVDGATSVDIRVASFALPQNLEVRKEMSAGLPVPDHTKGSRSSGAPDSPRRKLEVAVIAEIPTVLAFYRRELAAQNWKEETAGAVVTPDEVTLNFSSAEETATLRLGQKYDLTIVSLVTQVKEAVLAARAKAKKEADEKFLRDAEAAAKQVIAADEVREQPRPPIFRRRPCTRSSTRRRRCHCRKRPRTSSSTAKRANWNSTPPRA